MLGVFGGKIPLKSVLVGGERPLSFFLPPNLRGSDSSGGAHVHMDPAGKEHTPSLCARYNGTSSFVWFFFVASKSQTSATASIRIKFILLQFLCLFTHNFYVIVGALWHGCIRYIRLWIHTILVSRRNLVFWSFMGSFVENTKNVKRK